MTALDSDRGTTVTPFGTVATPSEVAAGQLRPRRQPRWIAAGVLALALGGLGASLLWGEAVNAQEVVVVQRAVPRGEVIRSTDLRVVQVGTLPGVSAVPGAEAGTLVGKKALVDLAPGSLLPRDAVGTPTLEKGATQIGLKLAPGRLPTGDLPQGTPVLLVPLEDPRTIPQQSGQGSASQSNASQNSSTQHPTIQGVVLSPPRPGPDGVSTLLDVRVDSPQARVVAELAAAERIALVKEASR